MTHRIIPTFIAIAGLAATATATTEPVTCDSPCDCHNAHGEGAVVVLGTLSEIVGVVFSMREAAD